jgi:hypothetical protein
MFWIYVTVVWISNKKALPSISDSWYYFPKQHKRMFMVFILGIAVPMFFQETGLFFFSGAFLCFTGAAPEFKDSKMTNTVHGIGAVGGIGFASVALLVEGIWFPIAIGALISVALRYSKIKNETWWIEIVWFTLLWFGLLARLYRDIDPEPTVERILGVAAV